MKLCDVCLNEGCPGRSIHLDATLRFADWMHGRGKFYASLKLKYYLDGEPYFSSQGAAMSLRDFIGREHELTGPTQLSFL